ncbi:uncharacterized protein Z518_04441 [Rhinocladiella mackenziei CBS 650.93]|uniref:RING-type E3 ubiquitin transferase n=1 Tax=Rhinocladiella mackenziei CBS 650.93 TaxID=1442369 RepID=A0A0D2JBJ1_9EURO|nr:uncharacterized protein Z518_04441 [Rhinocladiella mackenziei CBS 650.93]KIX06465.1 hypothetical protein Z518_04441 [Rhinocladiella mackenziei CBS 650.93]
MRPLRFLLLLVFFIALPIVLTCWSLFSSSDSAADSFHAGYNTRSSRLRALFSFSTPSSLFPPSAVISLTNDNSTFFLARPAAFGPSLPSRGLSGQLWVGRGFGDDALLKEENIHIAGWELGCSDVPGWGEAESKRISHLPSVDQNPRKPQEVRDSDGDGHSNEPSRDGSETPSEGVIPPDDGTDDYLHHPLPDSNPATPAPPGEPANIDPSDKNKKTTHADIESLQESADIAGKIVMLSRGGCGFLEKVKWAQRRGGIALIVGDNEKGAQLTIMYAKGDTSNVTIPALFTSYTSAHLLSSLVPPEKGEDEDGTAKGVDKASRGPSNTEKSSNQKQNNKPVFTSTKTGVQQPTIVPATGSGRSDSDQDKNWMKNVLSAIGLSENSPFSHSEDSRRPPSSGNIDWVLLEDWDDEKPPKSSNKANTASALVTASTSALKAQSTSSKRPGGDDFVIGVQDWRDTDLIAPKPTTAAENAPAKAKHGKDSPPDPAASVKTSTGLEATLKGGSITPGSGEYDHDQPSRFHRGNGPSKQQSGHWHVDNHNEPGSSKDSWLHIFRSGHSSKDSSPGAGDGQDNKEHKEKKPNAPGDGEGDEHSGLWVTLTPTSVSTSPFFDTLLVLVVSPLVTLTVVYALLLLRSRIRRRRWRAPKSVVERLPVRTYHTMSTTSSTTSSQVASPDTSSPTSPLLISTTQNVSQRPRPRSQTTTGIFPGASLDSQLSHSRSPTTEKPSAKFTRRKRYASRQVECVVCLEEYIDGESQVMSLPCGHEFHAECITPWLVTRRRTCPICKGDVVRSLARANSARFDDDTEEGMTGDEVQNRVAQTVNEEPSAAIPIPSPARDHEANRVDVDEDVERGQDADVDEPLLGQSMTGQPQERERQSIWRNIVSASVNRLSGDTLWRQTPVDRNR